MLADEEAEFQKGATTNKNPVQYGFYKLTCFLQHVESI